jgi:hypothetical protein
LEQKAAPRVSHFAVKNILALALALTTLSCALVDQHGTEAEAATRMRVESAAPSVAGNAEPATSSSDELSEGRSDGGWFGRPRSNLWSHWNALRGDSYELDDRDRFLSDGSPRLTCDATGLVNYSGKTVRYHGPVRVNEHFQPRLERFEALVAEVAEHVYGRAPRRIHHYGAYSCRTSRNRTHRLSEHALGNAIDVVGFDFGPLVKGQTLDPSLPKQLRHPFQVRVARHWENTKNPVNETHARFLRTVVDRLLDRDDVFRGVIGPGHRGHSDHFHFDMSPWRFVRM